MDRFDQSDISPTKASQCGGRSQKGTSWALKGRQRTCFLIYRQGHLIRKKCDGCYWQIKKAYNLVYQKLIISIWLKPNKSLQVENPHEIIIYLIS